MSDLWQSIVSRIRSWLGIRIAEPPAPVQPPQLLALPAPVLEPAPALEPKSPPIAPAPTMEQAIKALNQTAAFAHFEDILDDLPECRRSIGKLRKIDRDAWDYHHKLGARVVSDRIHQGFILPSLDRAFQRSLPASGMVFCPRRHWTNEYIYPTFVYFQKLTKRADYFDIPNDAVAFYRMTVLYVDVTKHDGVGRPVTGGLSCMVAVTESGRVHLLQELQTETFETPHARHSRTKSIGRNGRAGHGSTSGYSRHKVHIPRGKSWKRQYIGYHPLLYTWARDKKKPDTPQGLVSGLFTHSANTFASSVTEDFQVRAERHGVSVAFSVALGRTPYFFKDRQTTVAKDGKRKRIFHAVVEHQRVYPSGKVATVRAHYRGERRFEWHGETITITAPENSVMTWDAAAQEIDEEMLLEAEAMGMVRPGEAAAQVRSVLEDRRRLH